MNDLFRSMILGIVEGLTEFLPVSSTGHMLLVQPLIGVDEKLPVWKTLLWVSQFGAILAVIVYFWRDLWRQVFKPATARWTDHLLVKLFVAMVPTVVLALLLKKYAERYLENPLSVAIALIVGGAAMLLIDRKFRRSGDATIEHVRLTQAFWIGTIQCLSMWSGISRAGATIMGGMTLGLTPRVATEFSFYLAIPTMLAASAKTLWDERKHLSTDGLAIIFIGTAVSFIVALFVIEVFLRYVRSRTFVPFAIYRFVLGAAVLLWILSSAKS
ncbi:MAG: undecaprenyl-diphosphate phosphatase [Planctomycetes bacterium]|nr:undecaprenyl-diphosphate phosphatase [Planctomycetota bacterium]